MESGGVKSAARPAAFDTVRRAEIQAADLPLVARRNPFPELPAVTRAPACYCEGISTVSTHHEESDEPRWPAVVAMLAIVGVRFALPSELSLGPDWVLAAVVGALLVPAIVLHHQHRHSTNQILGYVLLAIVTADMIASLSLLISRLPAHRDSPQRLIVAASGLWSSNVLVFASWYWRLDAGGPSARERRTRHENGAFLFPQMQIHVRDWKPGFVDYLFLAFNTSTAFSPTDVPVLSRWAKMMMMVQSSISLGTVVILAARAVNIL